MAKRADTSAASFLPMNGSKAFPTRRHAAATTVRPVSVAVVSAAGNGDRIFAVKNGAQTSSVAGTIGESRIPNRPMQYSARAPGGTGASATVVRPTGGSAASSARKAGSSAAVTGSTNPTAMAAGNFLRTSTLWYQVASSRLVSDGKVTIRAC